MTIYVQFLSSGVPKLFGYSRMKCRMSSLQMEMRFSYLKLVHDRRSECVFGVSPRRAKPGSLLTRRLNNSCIISPLLRSDFCVCVLHWRYQILVGSRRSTFRDQFELDSRGKRINI
ncbi:hypothetical protein AVEN_94965-1 [Araneus ventricosus]|uniref:Uncharacterized protein n=1 Tax=Araneus ventricosus TaxID=182803 RepID=A0A4Y2DKU4_ARAVE|nr:hypothetical protein AVEN_94965-1 [Araneus ventricosus]